ncbi:MAG: YccF domain-containing protein [Acholeplasmataceae bacterium]|nr:YccF domain-containing protein [Acholeplasmataceae bacterium]MDY0339138.1 YccF domain-containing protein [Acholeplasmataceae bacterium]
MRLLGNIIWFILGGLIAAILWFILGLLLSVTIIGIPLGKQCFKFAGLILFPFGKDVDIDFSKHPIANIIWALLVGWEMALGYLGIAVFFFITIIGIPFGIQWFKLAQLALLPFGAKIR